MIDQKIGVKDLLTVRKTFSVWENSLELLTDKKYSQNFFNSEFSAVVKEIKQVKNIDQEIITALHRYFENYLSTKAGEQMQLFTSLYQTQNGFPKTLLTFVENRQRLTWAKNVSPHHYLLKIGGYD